MRSILNELFTNRDARRLVMASVFASTIVTSCVGLAGFRYWVERNPPIRLGVVDIATIVDIKEKLFTLRTLRGALSDEEMKRELDSIKTQFPQEMEKVMNDLAAECGCVLLNQGAYVGGGHNVTELTSVAVHRLGLDAGFSPSGAKK